MKKNQRPAVKLVLGLFALIIVIVTGSVSAQSTVNPGEPKKKESSDTKSSKTEKELIDLSKQKWQWMAERKVDSLEALFHEKAVFVHMGATMSKKQELDVIKSGGIQYKNTEIQEASVQIIDKTAILLNKIRLTAIVGGNEVVNPFMVTEVYVRQNGEWKLASLSFTRLLTPENR
jgi:4-carboxymuconolactone decarboxylase